MFKKLINSLDDVLFNPNKLIILVFSLMLTLVILKMISIFFLTMRGVGLGWPFNSYLFDPFHRFTDWLIPWAWAQSENPWDVDGEMIKHLPPSPYGPLTFYYMRLTAFLGELTSFFLLIIYFIFALFKIISFYYKDKYGVLMSYLITVALIVVCYPLHFIVDRGNADIFAGAIIIHLIYYFISSSNFDRNIILIAAVIIVGSKPTWIPFAGLLLIPFNFKYLMKGVFLIVLVYLSPVLFYDFEMIDYYKSIFKALEIMSGTVHFSNHLSTLFSWYFGSGLVIKLVLIIFGALLSLISVVLFNRCHSLIYQDTGHLRVVYLMYILVLSILTLLFNDPSPDYRLVILIPFLIIIPNIIPMFLTNRGAVMCLSVSVLSLSTVLSWSIYYLTTGFPISSPVRALSLFVLLVLIGIFLYYSYLFKSSEFCRPAPNGY